MQDRYAGDIGDFGKFGLLKAIEQTEDGQGLSIGINWYLTYPALSEKSGLMETSLLMKYIPVVIRPFF